VAQPETISLGDFTRAKNVFVLQVKGDSMVEDHILDGDYVLVEQSETANNGEIVVALVGNEEATLKRLFREPGGKIRLQPANAQMEPIVVAGRDVKIQGRVIGILRKY
jgi:repressor LexA